MGEVSIGQVAFLCIQSDEEGTQVYAELVHQILRGRGLFFTASEFIGIAPKAAKVRNAVAMFRGRQTPFSMKSNPMQRLFGWSNITAMFTLIGEAFDKKDMHERNLVLVLILQSETL